MSKRPLPDADIDGLYLPPPPEVEDEDEVFASIFDDPFFLACLKEDETGSPLAKQR